MRDAGPSDVILCVRDGCANPAGAYCGRCGEPFCAVHGTLLGKRYRGLYDVCHECGRFSLLRFVRYTVGVLAIVLVAMVVGNFLLHGPIGVVYGGVAGMFAAIVLLWRWVPE